MAFDRQGDSGLFVPEDYAHAPAPGSVVIDNRTDLPDAQVQQAIATYFEETLAWSSGSTFQTYATEGSMLARAKYQSPGNVFDEIRLARDMAERDDDVRNTIGAMVSIAFKDGMRHLHEDEETLTLYNKMAADTGTDLALKRMYREYLITNQLTTAMLFVPKSYSVTHSGVSRKVGRSMAVPRIGILKGENVRCVGDDMFGTAPLAYVPCVRTEIALKEWLSAYFSKATTEAKRADLRRLRPVWAYLFTAAITVQNESTLFGYEEDAYLLNPRAVHRTKAPCDGPYPRPPLLANFALLEAKRLLNIMDYALLQGGQNYIVIAKRGSDERPALPEEITDLRNTIKSASRTGVIIGDHRLSIEIVTPDLEELLNAEKREMIGRKLSALLLRVPPGALFDGEGDEIVTEMIAAAVTSDRQEIKRHVENKLYAEVQARNVALREDDAAKLWFGKIVLQGLAAFTDQILKLRDRGDIPREYAVEAGGYNYDAAVRQRKRELDRGDDDIMIPAEVPFSSPGAGPQDNGPGRPKGTSKGNGAPGGTNKPKGGEPGRQKRTIKRTKGETIKADFVDDEGTEVIRIGEITETVLAAYEGATIGRMRREVEHKALELDAPAQLGPVVAVPVNPEHKTSEHRVVRLNDATSVVVGSTPTGAMVVKAILGTDTTVSKMEDFAMSWGYDVELASEGTTS